MHAGSRAGRVLVRKYHPDKYRTSIRATAVIAELSKSERAQSQTPEALLSGLWAAPDGITTGRHGLTPRV